MNKEKALFGEWLTNFFSCEPSSYEKYISENPLATVNELANASSSVKDLTKLWTAREQPPNQDKVKQKKL